MKHPVIFIGMHRSGTSMLGRLLEQLGLFTGATTEGNHEATFFHWINSWLLSQCGGRWDYPDPVRQLWQHSDLIEVIEDYVRILIESPRAIEFTGFRRYALHRGVTGIRAPWGWKDPRNTFTLPFWLRMFPDARVLLIERHGIDVARSLHVRSLAVLERKRARHERIRWASWIRRKRGGFVDSPRCLRIEGAFSLWQQYVNESDRQIDALPSSQVLSLKYEELLTDPESHLRIAADFCGLVTSPERIRATCEDVNANRAYAYRNHPELVALAERFRTSLAERGYRVAEG